MSLHIRVCTPENDSQNCDMRLLTDIQASTMHANIRQEHAFNFWSTDCQSSHRQVIHTSPPYISTSVLKKGMTLPGYYLATIKLIKYSNDYIVETPNCHPIDSVEE